MVEPIALFDADVLASMTITDLIIECAHNGLFAARWSGDIHVEWIEAVAATRPEIPRARLERRRRLMDLNAPDCVVSGYSSIAEQLVLPDPGDRHVLAAAIVGHCSVIVTFNLRDFPKSVLETHGISAVHPDVFFSAQLARDREGFVACVAAMRARLKNPPRTVYEQLAQMEKVGLPALVKELAGSASAL